MAVETRRIRIAAKPDTDIIDITGDVAEAVKKSKIENGIATLFVPGSTASISTMEFEPNLSQDIKAAMERIAPSDAEYRHHKTWGDRNGKSHVRASLLGPGITIPFEKSKLLLGTWQQIVLMDFDVPSREREIIVQMLGD